MATVEHSGLPRALANAAGGLEGSSGVRETLDDACRLAVAVVAGCRSAGISEGKRGEAGIVLAASDDVARELRALQHELDGGPCTEAVWEKRLVWCDDFRDETRWPRFAAAAVEHGMRSSLAIQLFTHDDRLGVLCLYSALPRAFDEVTRDVAQIFAAHIAGALARVDQHAHLARGLTTRQRIGQATGIVAERHGLTTDEAFARLAKTSQDHNIRLRDLADQLVTTEDNARRACGPTPNLSGLVSDQRHEP